jgi:phenylpyruvate tautomerase PptA (4-oxalocrotonate tautomerase family)
MPHVLVEARRGLWPQQKKVLLEAAHAALVAAFKIPDTNRVGRFLEHAPEDFAIPAGKGERFAIVTIDALAGRSLEAKRALYREIVTRFEAAGIPKDDVVIVLHEIPPENWGTRGGQAASDLDLGFNLKV